MMMVVVMMMLVVVPMMVVMMVMEVVVVVVVVVVVMMVMVVMMVVMVEVVTMVMVVMIVVIMVVVVVVVVVGMMVVMVERYESGDFLKGGRSGYDAIWEHTCFCAIDPERRSDYAESAAEAVREGGRLFGVFYLDPDNDGDGPPFGATREEIIGCFGPWFDFVEGWVPARTYESRTGREWVAVFERSARGVARSGNGG